MTASPIVDDLDAAYAELRREPYTFQWAGQQFTLPHINDLDFRILAEIETLDTADVAKVLDLFNRMFGPEQAARWSEVSVPTPVLFMLFERWIAHGGGQLGEDSASSGSSGSTGKSSRRTSDASTATDSRSRSSAKKATPAKKAAPKKRAPRKTTTAKPNGALSDGDQAWLATHQALAGSPPANS
uniref:hypothetical protein n=1 Tax=Paractinoplanes polyasparticus TaxID=2856853 RepID=UPI001C8504F4|nr:hypothetical protein [Actinoplanes polyasparticus]